MSGPWDDYKADTKASSGPWDDFQSQQAPVASKLPPGVPQKPSADLDKPVTHEDSSLPWWMNYSQEFNNDSKSVKDFFTEPGLKDRLLHANEAGVRTAAKFLPSLYDTVLSPYYDITGVPKNAATNLTENILNSINTPGEDTQRYEANIGDVMNSIDPQMSMPWAHPTTPNFHDYATVGRIPEARPELRPIEVPQTPKESGPWEQYREPQPLVNQSALTGGAGAFDNIRRQTAGEIPESRDITNTPMERVTDTLLNNKDQAAMLGAENAGRTAAETNYWKQRAEQIQAEEAGNRDANAADMREQLTQPDSLVQRPMAGNDLGNLSDRPTMDALSRSTEGVTYENIPPDGSIPGNSPSRGISVPRNVDPRWSAPDENGIPVRQGLPQEPLEKAVQSIDQNTAAVNDLGNAIQEANGPKLGPDEHWGSEPLKTESPKFNVALERAKRGGPGGRQRGSIQLGGDDLVKLIKATKDLVGVAAKNFHELASKPLNAIVGMLPEDHMARISGNDMVYKPETGQKFADKAVAEGAKNPRFFKNFQSGPLHTAEKPAINSNALRGVGSWLQWADKRTHLDNRERVNPVQRAVKNLNEKDMTDLWQHMTEEQRSNLRKDPSGLSPKAQAAYKAMRDEFDRSFNQTVANAKAAGKEVPTREEAYHASMRQGDFAQSFFDKSGKLLGRVNSLSKIEALKAEAWFKKNHPNIDWQKSQITFAPDFKGINVPRDILGAYQQMLKFFDGHDPTITLVQDALARYQQEHGYSSRGFDKRLMDKKNIRGFEGDKPWLSDKENAKAFFNSQMKYLRDANHWNNFQEALNQIEPIMKNEELVKSQPRIMDYAKSLVQRELGISSNVLDKLETEWARNWPKAGFVDGKLKLPYLDDAQGISRGNVYKGVADLKTGTYLTMLGANIPYMITTPIQAALAIPRHMLLTKQGITHNSLKTIVNSLHDISSGLSRHLMSSMTGKDVNIPISDVGKRMLQYAENNGILDKTVMDETGNIGGHAAAEFLKKTVGTTITAPEKFARYSTFVSFAHHLMDSGKFTEAEAFQKAEKLTNDSLTSMRRLDKPLLVDKFGATGQLGYVFKSYLFNYYNQMAEYAGHAKRGNAAPLAAFVGMSFLMGGALSLPGVNEMDGFYNIFKNIVSSKFPQFYHDDLGIKGTLLKDLPTWASMGALSQATGTNIGTRFSTGITNPENPMGDIAVPIQELKEASTALDWAADPTERHALQAVHANLGSTLKGQMETNLDSFKNKNPTTPDGRDENGRMAYRKANNINDTSTDYKRTKDDEAKRALGFYSKDEYKTKQLRYINNTEQSRVMDAFTNLMNKAITKGVDGNTEAAGKLATAALKLMPDAEKYTKMIEEAAIAHGATPEEREVIRANAMNNLQKLRRLQGGATN